MNNTTIKQKKGYCPKCNDEKEKPIIAGLCSGHYWEQRRKIKEVKTGPSGTTANYKQIKQRSAKGQKVAKEDTEFFKSIWNERGHYCEICGESLGEEYNPVFFSHILTKSAFPKYRHNKDNILLMCFKHHNKWEFEDRSAKTFRTVFKRALYIHGKLVIDYYKK